MTSQLSTRRGKGLATAALILLTMALTAASASAATVSVNPNSGLSATAATKVAVSGGEYEAGEYLVGVCSTKPYGLFGIPACGEMAEVSIGGSGLLATSLMVEKTVANDHFEIMPPFNLGQPETFTCAGEVGVDDPCEVTVAEHGGSKEVVATAPISFK